MSGTWDDIFETAEKEQFVGREQELALFQQELGQARPRRLIFYISGQGGVGKTSLLQRYQETAATLGFLVAESDEQQGDMPTILGHFARQMAAAGHRLGEFGERYEKYRQLRQEIETDPDAPQGLAGLLARTTIQLGFGLLDEVPVARQVTRLVSDDLREGVASQGSEWAAYLAKKLANKDEVALVKDPAAVLTPLFFTALNKVAEKQKVLLCFDNFEFTRRYLDGWLARLREYKPSANIRLAIAGRTPPGPDWEKLNAATLHVPLEVFTDEEAERFLELQAIHDPERRREIVDFSGRLPVLMSWLAAPEGDSPDPAVPTADIVDRFLRWVAEPTLRRAALYLATPRFFNLDLVALLLERDSPAAAESEFEWLRRLPSVSERERGWQYHEVVRRYLLHYQRQKSSQTYRQLHGRLAGYYNGQRQALSLDDEAGWANESWRQYTLEYAYHHLAAGPDLHWPDFLNLFALALRRQRALARELADLLLVPASRDELSETQNQAAQLFNSQLQATAAGKLIDGFALFDYLRDQPLSPPALAVALVYHGEALRQLGRYPEAIADFNQAIELDEQDAGALARRGETHRLMGNYEAALADLNQAIELDEKNAWAIISRGGIYSLMENHEAALADLDRAIELDEKYAKVIAIRGEIYRRMRNYEAALADFNRAIELDEKNAWAITSRGETYRLMGNHETALADFNRA
ncbi:MAG: tetratricopeptide repeat protein, partial [Chloroflexi bacterium]|nr:tetratricopeptide repeat protein [Chloroflexota bacterium]MCI0645678.1 tetratricopeptide repeat protein [Chloroflexota bacterium]